MAKAYMFSSAVGSTDRTTDTQSRPPRKEVAMAAHGHTTTWGTYIGVGRAPQGQGWYA
jgi:hypothetical protein